MSETPQDWAFDYETLMNSQPFVAARYSTHHMGMGFALADEGEVYMICQGTGCGYGDVLEREPEAVMADLEADYLSSQVAREIYFVIHDPATLAVDTAGTEAARAAERQARAAPGQALQRVRRVLGHLGAAAALLRLVGRRRQHHSREAWVDPGPPGADHHGVGVGRDSPGHRPAGRRR
jgi:hypothetical protein